MKIDKKIIIENLKTIFYALLIAIIIRSFFIQPFYIPSSSMEPTLLIGDRLFVTKYSYGYSKHSLPFSPPIISSRLFSKKPKTGQLRKESVDFVEVKLSPPKEPPSTLLKQVSFDLTSYKFLQNKQNSGMQLFKRQNCNYNCI